MAGPKKFDSPIAQLEVGQIKETGFVAPPGWYGFVEAAGCGILRQAGYGGKEPECYDALTALGNPDLESKSQDYEGRRMIRIDGGYLILNFMKFRDKDHTAAIRQKRYRERLKSGEPRRKYVVKNVTV